MASSVPSLGFWHDFRGFVFNHKAFVILGLTMIALALSPVLADLLTSGDESGIQHPIVLGAMIATFAICVLGIVWTINLER